MEAANTGREQSFIEEKLENLSTWLKMRCQFTMFIKIGALGFGVRLEMIFVVNVDSVLQQRSVRKMLLDTNNATILQNQKTVMSNFATRWPCMPRTLKL